MASKIVVGYDGSRSARTALNFALDVAKAQGGSIVVAHVLEWSPYSFLSASELEERHKRRTEELERANTALIQPLLKDLETSGVNVTATVKYGNIAEVLVTISKSEGANHLVIGRTGHSALSSRLFGSVAGSLAQAAPVPVTIVP
ncbi:universal stress protein [Phaeobacter sp. C3_T13_0]|uniref:universal stress protein n=1 Tax=Phaeobacter cretensis TaxID=3342641 RepID=UPI0039BCC66B